MKEKNINDLKKTKRLPPILIPVELASSLELARSKHSKTISPYYSMKQSDFIRFALWLACKKVLEENK